MVGREWVGGHPVFSPTVILKPEMVQMARTTRVDSFVKIEGGEGVVLGEFVHIASFSHINVGGGTVVFENHSGCSSHCVIIGGTTDWNNLFASAAELPQFHQVRRYVTTIKKYAILFTRVTVMPGVTIGEGAIIKPETVVEDDVPAWAIMKGNPARQIGERVIYEPIHRIGV